MQTMNHETLMEINRQGAAELIACVQGASDGHPGIAIGQLVMALAVLSTACGKDYENIARGLRLAFAVVEKVDALPRAN